MIRKQEATGKTVDEARAKACALLGVQADDLNVSYTSLRNGIMICKLFNIFNQSAFSGTCITHNGIQFTSK